MNEKEISEIRRRFRPDRSGISHIRGCYVNENREIVSQFDQSLGLMSQEESEKLLAILRRTLSGTLGKNLADITFSTQQVVDSEEHRLLMALRGSSLADEEAVQALFQRVISSLTLEGNYLILLAHDTYDVPYRAKDGERMDDASDQVFSYILCSICPVKLTKPALSYFVYENAFHDLKADWVVSPPEAGFLLPARYHITSPLERIPHTGQQFHTGNRGDGSKSLSPKAKRSNSLKIRLIVHFARRVPEKSRRNILARDTAAIVGDAQIRHTAVLDLNRDSGGSGVNSILKQLLYDG